MTPRDVPGPLGLERLKPALRALVDATTPQEPRVAGDHEQRGDDLAEAA